jgi:hypothetical protein
MEDKLKQLESEIEQIKERNLRVEGDKAWERSAFRRVLILVVTYIIASIVMYTIGVTNYLLNALIPTVGYLLSTLSLPPIKRWWISRLR